MTWEQADESHPYLSEGEGFERNGTPGRRRRYFTQRGEPWPLVVFSSTRTPWGWAMLTIASKSGPGAPWDGHAGFPPELLPDLGLFVSEEPTP